MEQEIINGELIQFEKPLSVYKNFDKPNEDIDALLNYLVTTDNVPNDVFEHLKLRSVTRYYCPICVIAGQMLVNFSYEQQEGDRTVKVKDGMQAGAFLVIPCQVSGALPADISLSDEIMEELKLGKVDLKQLEDNSKEEGWKLEMPEGVDGDAVVDQYKDQMLAMVKDFAMKILKEELKNPSKLKIDGFEFKQNADDDEIFPGSKLCKQPVSIIEYEYKGNVFKAVYKKNEITAEYPVDSDSETVQNAYHKKMGLCVAGMVLMLILQFLLIHSWPVTFLVLLILGGVIFKFSRDLSKIQQAASGERGKIRDTLQVKDLFAALKG